MKKLTLQGEDKVEIEFYPFSSEQNYPQYIHPAIREPLEVMQKNPYLSEKVQKEIEEIYKEDEKLMSIIENPSQFEDSEIRDLLGEDNG